MSAVVMEADYVIVGAGSAGCTLANRLSEDGTREVVILEAGGWDRDPLIKIPVGWGMLYSKKLHDWRFETEPEEALLGRRVEFARGKVIGGCSSTNAMAYVRGHRSDYERWASMGLPEWTYEKVLPYFRKQESWEAGASEYRGGSGPLKTRASKYEDPLIDAASAAGIEAGFSYNPDYNGANQEGIARLQSTIDRGRRCSAAAAYLHPALKRKNLKVVTSCRATRIVMNGTKATGVEIVRGGTTQTIRARREVIVSAGVAMSPHLLMLSGIGDAEQLGRNGIKTVINLPRVGRGLRDHVSPVLLFRRKHAGPFHAAMRYDRIALGMLQAAAFGTGIASDVPCGFVAFLQTRLAEGGVPDVQLLLNAAPLSAKPYLHPMINGYDDGFGLRVVLLRPRSEGTVSLASPDPMKQPRIHQNFLQHEEEWAVLREGIKIARSISRQSSLGDFIAMELVPGERCSESDTDLDQFIRERALTTHHPLGTCAMAREPHDGVVDTDLRVFGAEGLRVVDASVMPDMIGGNINAAVIMIAEKIADRICESGAHEAGSQQAMKAAHLSS